MSKIEKLKFPKNFYWGTATAAHQVDGNCYDDWSDWERDKSEYLANKASSEYGKYPVWPKIKDMAQDPSNYISGVSCDHYNRYKKDFDIMQKLNLSSYRFSVDWARVEPKKNMYNKDVLAHYVDFVKELNARNIEPFVTLWHWPVPLWVAENGGWERRVTIKHFQRFVAKMVHAFGKEVKYYITLNEPLGYTSQSYYDGVWPPQKTDFFTSWHVLSNLIAAHNDVYSTIKGINSKKHVGVAKNFVYNKVNNPTYANLIKKRFYDKLVNYHFMDRIKGHLDFIGMNYYFYTGVDPDFKKSENAKFSDLQWELYPEGLYLLLKEIHKRYKLPIYITEHGLADAEDVYRKDYIKESLKYVHRAISEKIDVKGYFHWSFMDNFEWDKGFWPRFGLVEVDYKNNLKRKIRNSAKFYAQVAKENAL
jgi:beta-glucosidase